MSEVFKNKFRDLCQETDCRLEVVAEKGHFSARKSLFVSTKRAQ